jgi:hypothetical protein
MTHTEFTELARRLEWEIDLSALDDERERIRLESNVPRGPAAMVCRLEPLKIKMYQEHGHKLPHLHVDYGRHNHVASYSIEPTEVLEGSLPSKHHAAVQFWIRRNKAKLLQLWDSIQSGVPSDELIADLRQKA